MGADKKSKNLSADISSNDLDKSHSLTSLEEVILRMRFGLKEIDGDVLQREISESLRKKLLFLELKAFEQSGRIKELLSSMEAKRQKR